MTPPSVLIDTNAIIEAVRTGVWAAIAGQRHVETVEACREEALAVPVDVLNYIPVTVSDVSRLKAAHSVSPVSQAALKLAYGDADLLDRGEHDLLAHVNALGVVHIEICSSDKAAIRAALALGLGDQLVSLEQLAQSVGARGKVALRRQFMTHWLVSFRSQLKLEGL